MANPNPTLSSKGALDLNHDVLAQIFGCFLPSDPSLTTVKWRGQLLNLALVCTAFLDPAMDCLWSYIESLEPLLKLHPANFTLMGLHVSGHIIPNWVGQMESLSSRNL
jgi:hypothetical protein